MTMEIEKLVTRPFSPEQDIAPLLTLYSEVESVDHHGMDISEQALQQQLDATGHDLLHQRWVVEAPDDPKRLIGSALVKVSPETYKAEANILVHPAWRQQGIGSHLLSRIIDRSLQLKAQFLHIYAHSKHSHALSFLSEHAFTPQGAYTELRLAEGVRLPPVIWPFGYSMRPYSELQDLTILTQAMNLCYIPLWGHSEVSEQEMATWLPHFVLPGIFLVFSEKGRVVGISRVEPSAERTQKNGAPTGYIDAPGIVPQHRRLDLYRALLLTGIQWLHDQGQTIIEMESWGDKLEVLKMYRELGFSDLRQLVCYQLVLPSAGVLS